MMLQMRSFGNKKLELAGIAEVKQKSRFVWVGHGHALGMHDPGIPSLMWLVSV